MNLNNLKNGIIRTASRGGLLLKKNGPQILLGAGLASGAAALYLVYKATRDLDDVMAFHQVQIDHVKKVEKNTPKEEYPEEVFKQDLMKVYIKRGVHVFQLYAPAGLAALFSASCFIGGHSILNRRNVALMGAYAALDESYKKYRERVEKEYGPEFEQMIHYNTSGPVETEKMTSEDGSVKDVKTIDAIYPEDNGSIYAVEFNRDSPEFSRDYATNIFFLEGKQKWANLRLKARGHLFLNEVYDMLGLPRTEAGQLVGWMMDKNGDDRVEFDIYGIKNISGIDPNTGWSRPVLLDFNVDGIIYNLL